MPIPIDKLVVELRCEDAAQRAVAAEQLCQEGDGARPAAVALVQAAADSSEVVREWAVSALEELIKTLQTRNEHLQPLPASLATLQRAASQVQHKVDTLITQTSLPSQHS